MTEIFDFCARKIKTGCFYLSANSLTSALTVARNKDNWAFPYGRFASFGSGFCEFTIGKLVTRMALPFSRVPCFRTSLPTATAYAAPLRNEVATHP